MREEILVVLSERQPQPQKMLQVLVLGSDAWREQCSLLAAA